MQKGTPIKTRVVAGCVIKRDDKFLLVQEKKERVYGLWSIPAGKVDEGESIEEAAIRETKEETGFDVRLVHKLGVFHTKAEDPVRHGFMAEIISGELSFKQDELLDAKWFSLDEIRDMKDILRNDFILSSIELSETWSG